MPIADPPSINRELSTLAFQRRVLALASDDRTPLLERLRYLGIVGSNLDEFFEIRFAGLKEHLRTGIPGYGLSLQDIRALVEQVATEARTLVAEQYRMLNEDLLPALAAAGVRLLRGADRDARQRAWVADYFEREVRPLLTPIGLDPAHPFPQVGNKSLNFVVELSGKDAFGRHSTIAIVRAPRLLPRVLRLPPEGGGGADDFVLLSSVMHAHLADLFAGRQVVAYAQFRVTRDADLWIDEEEVTNLRHSLQGELSHRHFGRAVRLEVAAACPDRLANFLLQQFELGPDDLYRCDGPVNIVRLQSLIDQVDIAHLKFEPFRPAMPARLLPGQDILAAMRKHDILLHHPYETFEPVVEFVRKAADDPDVVAIKQTVYRTGTSSALMEGLVAAAQRGKEVTVVVELLARFDEEANINWAERLEQAGAQVVYGVFGMKTHAKLALLTRREPDGRGGTRLVHYAHLGTGNYHPQTTRLYTDFGLLTANAGLCREVAEVFLHITSLARAQRLRRLILSPFTMQSRVIAMIRREARNAKAGRPAGIKAKMNALLDTAVIHALYEASRAGVPIDLVVRGACALRPGVEGVSDNIRVRSILGRFLEHHRVWRFENGGTPAVWLSSADWMGRNLFKRIEVAFPVGDPELAAQVAEEGLDLFLEDTEGAWELRSDASWHKVKSDGRKAPRSAQAELLARVRARNGRADKPPSPTPATA